MEEDLQAQTKFYLLLSFDIDANVKDIIENELLPYIDKNLELFNWQKWMELTHCLKLLVVLTGSVQLTIRP